MSSTVATQIPTGTWSIDPVHSSIGFGVKHFGVSTFRGSFSKAAGSIVTDDGATEFRLMQAPLASPGRESWTEVVAENDDNIWAAGQARGRSDLRCRERRDHAGDPRHSH